MDKQDITSERIDELPHKEPNFNALEKCPTNLSADSPVGHSLPPKSAAADGDGPPPPSDDDFEGFPPTQANFADAAAKIVQAKDDGSRFAFLGFLQFAGASVMAVIAYLDPGNLEADIGVGAQAGYSLFWFLALSNLVLGFSFQCMAGKLGLVTGEDLATHIGRAWPRGSRILLWILIEISVIAADIQETVGSAIAIAILSGGKIPLYGGCLLVSATAYGLLYLDRLGFRYIECVYAALVAIEAIAMGINCFSANIPAEKVLKGLVIPKLDATTVTVAVGALGALVMPYNMFFQSHVVNGRPRDNSTDAKKRTIIQYMRLETFIMLAFAFVVNLFVVCVFAKGLEDATEDEKDDIGLESAGEYLGMKFGTSYKYLWAVGLLAAGQVSTLCLTYAGQIIMVGLLNIKVGAYARMGATRLIALVPTVTLAVVFESTHTFDRVAQTINILQSMILPFGLIPVIHMTTSSARMGEKFKNAKWFTYFTSFVVALVFGVNGYLLLVIPGGENPATGNPMPASPGIKAAFGIIVAFYYSMGLYFAVGPLRWPTVIARTKSFCTKAMIWIKTHRRWADIESMLEVHI